MAGKAVRSKATSVAAAGRMTSATTAALGENRQRDYQEHERRNEERSMHMFIICLTGAARLRN
jgi:hypothetical protein